MVAADESAVGSAWQPLLADGTIAPVSSLGRWLTDKDDVVCTDGAALPDVACAHLCFPRNWPAVHKTSAPLRRLLNKTLQGTRCRVVRSGGASPLTAPLARHSFSVAVASAGATPGWRVVKGFAVLERVSDDAQAGGERFVAVKHWWCSTGDGTWVDVAPLGREGCGEALLVESALGEKDEAPLSVEGRERACQIGQILLLCPTKGRQVPRAQPAADTAAATGQYIAPTTTQQPATKPPPTKPPPGKPAKQPTTTKPPPASVASPPARVKETSVEVMRACQSFERLAHLAHEAGEDDAKLDAAGCVGPFGEVVQSTPVSDDVLVMAMLGWPPKQRQRPAVTAYLTAALDWLGQPTALVHAALCHLLAPCGTLDGLKRGPAARSGACWLRVKTFVAAKAFLDDERIERASLRPLSDEENVASRAEWARIFGVPLKRANKWAVERSDAHELLARVHADGGELRSLSIVELLSLLRPHVVRAWHTPIAFYTQATSHHAEIITREGVQVCARRAPSLLGAWEGKGWVVRGGEGWRSGSEAAAAENPPLGVHSVRDEI